MSESAEATPAKPIVQPAAVAQTDDEKTIDTNISPPVAVVRPEENEEYSLKVKPEFILTERSSVLAPIPVAEPAAVASTNKPEAAERKGVGKKKNRGQNRKRPRDPKTADADKLCNAVVRGEECPYEKCRYSHNIKKALADRQPDITGVEGGCPNFNLTGYCDFGIHCRLGSEHINMATGQNLRKDIVGGSKKKAVLNVLSKEVQSQLRRKKYPFVCKRHFERDNKDNSGTQTKTGDDERARNSPKPGALIKQKEEQDSAEESIALPSADGPAFDLTPLPATRKLIDFSNKVYVAPLTTVGNLPFRRIMKKFGADITCGEMAIGSCLLQGQNSEWALMKRHPDEDIFGVQVAAGFPDQFTRVSELLESQCTVDFVDVNMGCPLDIVCNKHAGSALMLRDKKLRESLEGMSRTLTCPFTVKMRTGWFDEKPIAHLLVPKIQSWQIDGLNAVMIHGRSRLQRYSRQANWDYIAQVSKAQSTDLPKIPVIGNGDIFSYQDYEEKVKREGVEATAMLARGALIKPWLPTEIKERRDWDISATERLEILKEFVRFGLEHWGSDQQGVNNTRRYLLEWLSFLYRYMPVGMLEEGVSQAMNARPPRNLCGRSDLETLMLSSNCQDWIKISELLLGPCPDGFRFEPKHKANAYKAAS
mmetsp:Transcript_27643/g.61466  ORF Transcript_27643/g.61466 Transcript_27643/m.61466 type:complete len:649 (+) Transcript_27643:89-2035(+)